MRGFNAAKHTLWNQYLPIVGHFVTNLKYYENQRRIHEKRSWEPSTSAPPLRGTYHVGVSSGTKVVDVNFENPRVKTDPQTTSRAVKRARYQTFGNEFIPENHQIESNLRTVTYIFNDEENNRTFIAVVGEDHVAPILDLENEEEEDPNENEPDEEDPIEENDHEEEKESIEEEEEEEPIEEEETMEEDEPIEDEEPFEDEADMKEGIENPYSNDKTHHHSP
ncbi:protein FANTASTIC FOUR 1-like [Beta vulgaris subsp. vulgaris]|uniref:protein FANTASTIC FOUR 1-like n=1 Tax=Beta vulgaris subsp. vulgaris TaxID=3555 RepID=UPI00053FD1EC|nr:protein FANTASTIC FOUR 1-like [Beta vulgaris subsp. vulgaris]